MNGGHPRELREAYDEWMAAGSRNDVSAAFRQLEQVARRHGFSEKGLFVGGPMVLFVRKKLGVSLTDPEAP